KVSGRRELRLPVEAVTAALSDAGLTAADVDGLVTFTMDSNAEIAVARELGLRELRFLDQIGYGGGAACATVQHAAMAVATGTADAVVCYRALNERSGRRFGQVAVGLAGVPAAAGGPPPRAGSPRRHAPAVGRAPPRPVCRVRRPPLHA